MTTQHRIAIVAAFDVMKRMLLDEFPSDDIVEIVNTWGDPTPEELTAVATLERFARS